MPEQIPIVIAGLGGAILLLWVIEELFRVWEHRKWLKSQKDKS